MLRDTLDDPVMSSGNALYPVHLREGAFLKMLKELVVIVRTGVVVGNHGADMEKAFLGIVLGLCLAAPHSPQSYL